MKFLVLSEGDVSKNEYPPVDSKVRIQLKSINKYFDYFYQLVAIGWGQTSEQNRTLSKELRQVTIEGIRHESDACQMHINSEAEQFCAGARMGGKGKKKN